MIRAVRHCSLYWHCWMRDGSLATKLNVACKADYSTNILNPDETCCGKLMQKSLNPRCNVHKITSFWNQSVTAPARSSCLSQPSIIHHYHSIASPLSGFHGRLRTVECVKDKQLLFPSHHSVLSASPANLSSFSPTKLILQLSPASLQPYLRLIRFDKPIGTWLLYWPCTWSIALAAAPGTLPDFKMLALFGAGAFFMRSAGCIINDMWDKDFDAKVARTKTRPLAAGEITQFQALVCLGTQLSCALAFLLQLNIYSVLLGASSLAIVILYPLFKRVMYWPQLILGLTLNWGVLLSWSALKGSVELPGLVLYLTCALYTVIYDTVYAHQDKTDDMIIGVKSTAILMGEHTKACLSVFAAAMAGGMTLTGSLCHMTWPYYLAVGITTAKIAHQLYSINLDKPEECSEAFRDHFYIGALIFAGIVLANLIRSPHELFEAGLRGPSVDQVDSGQDSSAYHVDTHKQQKVN